MNGDVVWRRYFGGSNNDRSFDSVETQDGGFILVGTSESQDIEISNSFALFAKNITILSVTSMR